MFGLNRAIERQKAIIERREIPEAVRKSPAYRPEVLADLIAEGNRLSRIVIDLEHRVRKLEGRV